MKFLAGSLVVSSGGRGEDVSDDCWKVVRKGRDALEEYGYRAEGESLTADLTCGLQRLCGTKLRHVHPLQETFTFLPCTLSQHKFIMSPSRLPFGSAIPASLFPTWYGQTRSPGGD